MPNDTKHTPGPWRILPAGGFGQTVIVPENLEGTLHNERRAIARLSGPDAAANAKLISKAPEYIAIITRLESSLHRLLHELKDSHNSEEQAQAWMDISAARAAIQAATGGQP